MDCKDIIKNYLIATKYDGLYNLEGDTCGCLLDDFMPCGGEFILDCKPGYKTEGCSEECGQGCNWHVGPDKSK